ncbi:hypothetical protein QLQ12_40305 [Actinoplanes sp. NEAU-A12]|uniref:Uncharacterized protein n=1 Tax=Actinoplanes sandaracinus TaxID=3045177 RepID=A0ABT6WYL3_9ACTN|nr:hypothetical protein [Actinoplanes sandaracinus]MDI6104848.1 hypothetical protein [Actinoplanes sandaracinus]
MTVTVEVRQSLPAHVETGDWDEVIETDFHASTGDVVVRALMDDPPPLPALTTNGPGTYRFRVHAAGRDLHPDAVAFEPTESYLIQTWPTAAPQAEIVYQQSDTVGAELRRSATTAALSEAPSPPRPPAPRPALSSDTDHSAEPRE